MEKLGFLRKIGMAVNIFVDKFPWECKECKKKETATVSAFRMNYDVDCIIQRDHRIKSPQCIGKASIVG